MGSSAVLLRALLGVTVIMGQTILKLAFLATTAIAAPAADAEADPFYGLAYAHPAPIVHALPICKAVPKTVVVGKRCHAEPECTTNLWWSVRPSRDMRTQSVLRSRFPLSATDTLARERLRLNLSTASPTVLTSLYL